MNITELRQFINNLNHANPDSIILKLVVKNNDVYQSYNVVLDLNLRLEIKEMYSNHLATRLYDLEQKLYNPNIVQDGCVEVCDLEVANISEVIEKLEDEEYNVDDVEDLDLNNVNFYVLKFSESNNKTYIFRRFNKLKKLRRGFFGIIDGNTFHKLDNTLVLGLDSEIDTLVYEEEALIVNRFALQTIFNMNDYFIDRATQALDQVEKSNVISNFINFRNDCIGDRQAVKRITKIMNTPNRLEDFIKHADRLPEVIQEAKLEVTVDVNGSLEYDGTREIRSEILFCMADAYYLSLLLQRIGEDVAQ
ncbi:DUF4868 domain-containing protein [Vagococcus lutrae]|uniref:Kiwa anti-phage protein KwaB-like domain-containing protein n=1 Tax=Vagococcus lutrae TaxID=81947 RepID=UPI001C96A2BD|nr:Kiwa anti-phage protein KwaB-like domain-containing protein [Vagococcus lutrae]QZN89140.1 DUF4868 domain-containing protein [Vagococcus lutrae]